MMESVYSFGGKLAFHLLAAGERNKQHIMKLGLHSSYLLFSGGSAHHHSTNKYALTQIEYSLISLAWQLITSWRYNKNACNYHYYIHYSELSIVTKTLCLRSHFEVQSKP